MIILRGVSLSERRLSGDVMGHYLMFRIGKQKVKVQEPTELLKDLNKIRKSAVK